MSGHRGTAPVLVAGAAVAAFTGAVLAVALLGATRDVDRPVFLAVLVGAAVLLAVLAAATVTASPAPPEPRRPVAGRSTPSWNAAPSERERPAAPPQRERPAAAIEREQPAGPPGPEWRAAPADPPQSEGQWWSTPVPTALPAAPRPSTPAGPLVPDLDLPEPPAGTRIVTCPRCNGERVDLRHAGDAFALDCTECRHQWSWAPGSPWPVTVVRPRLRPAAPR